MTRTGSRRALALGALVAGALALAACRGGGDEAKTIDAGTVLTSAAARMEVARSYHFELVQENGTTAIMPGVEMLSASGDVAGPERQRVNVRARAGSVPIQLGIVVLPDASYMTHPLTGRWEPTTLDLAAFFDPATGMTALMRSATEPRLVATETLNGVSVHRIEARIDSGRLALFAAGAPAGRMLPVRAWVGVDDPLVHRIEVDGGITASEPPAIKRRLDLSRFGEDPAITAPR